MTETAVVVGSISYRIPSHIFLGSVTVRVPAIKIAITGSSNDVMNDSNAPEIIPGLINGKVTLKKAFTGWAPNVWAANSIFRLRLDKEADTVKITNGKASAVCDNTNDSLVSIKPRLL